MKLAILSIFILSCLNIPGYSQWVQTAGTPQGGGITDMLVTPNGTLIVTCASYNFPNGQSGGIRHSTDGGNSWQNDYMHYNARTLAMGQNGYVYASSWDYPNISEGLWVSFNQGADWVGHLYLIGSNNNIFSILVRDNNQTIYIGTRTGVRKSTNGGGSFTPVNTGMPSDAFVYDLDIDPSGFFIAAGTSKGLYVTSNNGSSWNAVSGVTQNDTIYTVKFANIPLQDGINENVLFGGSSGGKIFESDAGAQFLSAIIIVVFFAKLGDIEVINDGTLTIIGASLAAFDVDNIIGAGFAYSTDRGQSWHENNSGLPANPRASRIGYSVSGGIVNWKLGLFDNTTNGAKIYKMSSPIGIHQISSEVPNAFSLSQNYPNPFNPMTKIKFNVTKTSNVSITVFDVLGRHVTTLVNEKLNAGSYETEWNANNMPGGVYFYKLETEDFSETKKMILVK